MKMQMQILRRYAPQDDTASDGFVLSHLSDKNKDVAKVGHPKSVVRARNSLSASEAAQDDRPIYSTNLSDRALANQILVATWSGKLSCEEFG